MNETTKQKAEKIKFALHGIEDTQHQLNYLHKHSFGFGTSFRDIDEFLRPITKMFLESKQRRLEIELEKELTPANHEKN